MFEPAVPGTRNDPGMDNGLISAMLPPLAGEWPPNLACVGFACGNIVWRWELKMTIRSNMLAGAAAACCLAMGFAGAATAQTMQIIFPSGSCIAPPATTGALQIINFDCSSYFGGIVTGQARVQQGINLITGTPVTNFTVTNFIAQTNGLTTSATGEIKFKVPQSVGASGVIFINMALTGQFYFGPGSLIDQPNGFEVVANATSHPFGDVDTIYADSGFVSIAKTGPNPLPFTVAKTGFIGVDDPNYLYISFGFSSSASHAVTGIRMPGSFHMAIGADEASAVFLPIPEPESWALMVAGFGAVGLMVRRRRLALSA